MILFELCYKKYHRSIIKNVIKASQKRHEAFLIAKLPTLQEVPQKIARRLGTLCSPHGQQVPNAWSVNAQRLVYWCPTLGPKVPI